MNENNKISSTTTSTSTSTALFSASANNDNSDNSDNNSASANASSRPLGILVLLTVPFAWGTYAPVVKYVYEMDPPVPGFVFSGGYYLIAAFTLSFLSFIQHQFMTNDNDVTNDVTNDVATDVATDVTTGGESQINVIDTNTTPENDELSLVSSTSTLTTSTSTSTSTSNKNQQSIQLLAGLELGSYLFIGNCLQVIGLKTVPADRAAFLVQLTTIMVPLFSALFAGDLGTIPLVTWAACVLAFMGVTIMGLDGPDFNILDIQSIFTGLGDSSYSNGDLLIISAAVAYTMHVIRLGRYAKFTTPLGLAASKAGVEAVYSFLLISFLITMGTTTDISFLNEMSTEITTYFHALKEQITLGQFPPPNSAKVIGAILWTGWVTCAYTIYAQSFGQRRVEPTDANLIYSIQPLCSALFAYALIGEQLGQAGYVGGSLIASALWIVTASGDDNDTTTTTKTQKGDILDLDDNLKME